MSTKYTISTIESLNKDIERFFSHLYQIDPTMHTIHEGVSRLVMLDRYAQKDINLISLKEEDTVLVVVKDDPKFPARGIGKVIELNKEVGYAKSIFFIPSLNLSKQFQT